MAHTLQAALVIPVVLASLATTTGLLMPVLLAHEQSARQFVSEQQQQLTLEHLYQIPAGDETALLTSPQQLIAWMVLAEDIVGLLNR
ncbi:MAG: hypothetical protein PHQ83_03470 [Eubacteriales bacterium]|nr:hypothetical protein [Eubacteriales bacterium]